MYAYVWLLLAVALLAVAVGVYSSTLVEVSCCISFISG
jgi:hypothetical protein